MTARPLSVTHVVGTGLFAGLERYVVEVSNELAGRGHHVHVVGGAPDETRAQLDDAVTWAPGASPREAVRSLVRHGRCDVVHSHISKADFVALAAAPATRGRRVSTRHIAHPRGHHGLSRVSAPLVRRLLASEVAVSHWLAEQVETVPDTVILNGVRVEPDSTAPRRPTVVMTQRLAPEKDTDVGIRAWASSGLAQDGWRLLVAGRGDERDALERLAVELGVADSVELLGWVTDAAALYRSSGLMLAPAPTEPCGLAVLEAMAHGLPVVAAGAGGHLETVGQHPSARLFAPGDHLAAAAHLRRLADDAEDREAYGTELRDLQRARLSLSGHVDLLEQLYVEVAR